MKTKATILLFCVFSFFTSLAQPTQFSLASDVTVIRSLKKEQRFWTIGQTVAGHFHFAPKDGMYVLFTYSANGKFNDHLVASARDSVTLPQHLGYTNKATMRFNHISIGWKRYLKGNFKSETGWNLYGYGGFGLFFGEIENIHSQAIDTANYLTPVLKGKDNFKRLTLDLSLGFEVPAGGDIFIYMEARTHIPTTDYPSKYLFVNNDAPFIASFNTGLRILFE